MCRDGVLFGSGWYIDADSVVARQTRTLLVAMAVGLTATWGVILATCLQLAAQI